MEGKKTLLNKIEFHKNPFSGGLVRRYVEEVIVYFRTAVRKLNIGNVRKTFEIFVSYLKIWFVMSKNSLSVMLSQKLLFALFLTGKVIRFVFYFAFIYFLVKGSDNLAGYNVDQTIFFFLTFTLIDSTSQFLYREVYRFRSYLVSGDFDLILIKPFSALFRVLLGGMDVIDLVTLPPLLGTVIYVGARLDPTVGQVVSYSILVVGGLLIATAFHVAVVSLGILTLEIDHTVMIFRDLTSMGRFPIDIYKQPLRGILTYVLPVGIMMSLPAKALFGLVSPLGVLMALGFGVLLVFAAGKFWKVALKSYTSASS